MLKRIYAHRMQIANWWMIAAAFAGVAIMLLVLGYDPTIAMAGTVGLALVTLAGMAVVVHFWAGNQIAELSSDGTVLDVELLNLFGRGRRLQLPIADITGWYAFTGKGAHHRFSVVGFSHRGVAYRMPTMGAQVFDADAFMALAPGAVSTN